MEINAVSVTAMSSSMSVTPRWLIVLRLNADLRWERRLDDKPLAEKFADHRLE